jgi:hypothetical protein
MLASPTLADPEIFATELFASDTLFQVINRKFPVFDDFLMS